VLITSDNIAAQNSFVIGTRLFVAANPDLTAKVIEELARIINWAAANRDEVSRLVSVGTGVPYETTLRAMQRSPFKITPVTEDHVRSQQAIADRFLQLGVIPGKIDVASQVWRPNA
jgi:sulfonate transport system substrate-binding protein